MGTVWILNLDAEAELERPRGYSPTRANLQQNLIHEERAAQGLIREGDSIWREGEEPSPDWRGAKARAWCPTPRTLQRFRTAGLHYVGAAPELSVLRRVNDRQFCAEMGQQLPGAFFAQRESDFAEVERADRPEGWLLKRSFGVAGRGRRKLTSLQGMTEADRQWIRASLRRGGLQVEPWCSVIEAEFVQEGIVDGGGSFQLGQPLLQHCTPEGAWQSCVDAGAALENEERNQLRAEGERVAHHLFEAGYVGPFALDAYRARIDGARQFVARSEINARYSMGWSLGSPDYES